MMGEEISSCHEMEWEQLRTPQMTVTTKSRYRCN